MASSGKPADLLARAAGGALDRRRSLISGALCGVGVAGFVDETVFHQLLHWHHFYDRSTPTWGLISDGMFHAASWLSIVGGLFLFADLRRRSSFAAVWLWSGFFLGLGGFQLYDGTFQHKWWRFHQIRYHVNLLPYDLIWNATAAVTLLVGVALLARARRERKLSARSVTPA
jgi:uncharacterized membrane protein